ncbi:MAG: zinc-finger domain-containing protein [Pseudomonadota bacterium]|nr:zinc-finger domain-containing protein [Pseudomonadota bacterium]
MFPPSPPETITVETDTLHCDGGTGALGHPRIYMTMGAEGTVDCPYCSRHFVLATAENRTNAGH